MAGGFGDELSLRLSPEIMTEQPDLTLRLSLGGKSNQNPLTRSSSVIGVISQSRSSSFLSLARSCSLPAETDQLDRIKRKELQLMRRLEAKKRLLEQRSGRGAAVVEEKSLETAVAAAEAATPPSPSEVAAWAAASAAKSPALCRAIDKIKSLQGSLSQSHGLQGHGTLGSSSSQSSLELNDIEQVVTSKTMTSRKYDDPMTNAAKRARVTKELMEGVGVIDMMKTMPNVSTIGDGPNGRKVEGLLYKYKKGEVCIVCVCHGSFLTPAEFVKHAGGREVANPMKHIHVYCTSFSWGNERKYEEQ